MGKKINLNLAVGIIVLVLGIAAWLIFWQISRFIVSQDRIGNNFKYNQENTRKDVQTDKTGIANPASVFCEKNGGLLEIRTATDGGQTGYCVFANGTSCEEWKFFRGECSPTTGTKSNQNSQTKKTILKKVSVGERYTSYEGSITVSGRYEEFNPDTMLGGGLCFHADEATGYLIPREADFWAPGEPDIRNPWFCFSNQAAAKKMLGVDDKKIFADKTVDCFSGPATVTVSHYVTDKLESETSDKAQLDKVISFKKYSPICGD